MSDTVACKICGTQTEMTGTKLCDRCWKIESGIESLRSDDVLIAYEYCLDKAIELYRQMKGKT